VTCNRSASRSSKVPAQSCATVSDKHNLEAIRQAAHKKLKAGTWKCFAECSQVRGPLCVAQGAHGAPHGVPLCLPLRTRVLWLALRRAEAQVALMGARPAAA